MISTRERLIRLARAHICAVAHMSTSTPFSACRKSQYSAVFGACVLILSIFRWRGSPVRLGLAPGGPRRICVLKGSWDTNPLPIEEIAMGYRRICHVGRVARVGVRCSARMIARRAFAFEIGRMGMRGSRCRVSEKRSRACRYRKRARTMDPHGAVWKRAQAL